MRGCTIILLLAATAGPVLAQDEPAQVLPAHTGAFIQINNLSQWRKSIGDDPIMRYVVDVMPHRRHQEAWQHVQTMMNMSEDEILDRFLGARLVIAGPQPGWSQPMALMMRVQPDDTRKLVERFSLEPLEGGASYEMYSTPDNSTRLAISKQWVSVARSGHEPYLRQSLAEASAGPCLADDPQFKQWIARLPKDCEAMAFFRGHPIGQIAAVAVVDEPDRLTVHYAGRPAHVDELFEKLGSADALEMGPLPRSVVAAVSINVYDPNMKGGETFNRLIAPKTFEQDILPKIDAPLIGFVAAPQGRKGQTMLPVFGVAVKLREGEAGDQVVADLEKIIDNAMMVASVNTMAWGTPPILTQTGRHNDQRYRIADVGVVIGLRTKRDEFLQLRFSYGKVGDWFIACTSDQFFNECLDANADADKQLATDPTYKAMPLRSVKQPIATLFLRGPRTQQHLGAWIQYWRDTRPSIIELAKVNPADLEAKIARTAVVSSHFFEHCESITAQFRCDEDDVVVGEVNLVRR